MKNIGVLLSFSTLGHILGENSFRGTMFPQFQLYTQQKGPGTYSEPTLHGIVEVGVGWTELEYIESFIQG